MCDIATLSQQCGKTEASGVNRILGAPISWFNGFTATTGNTVGSEDSYIGSPIFNPNANGGNYGFYEITYKKKQGFVTTTSEVDDDGGITNWVVNGEIRYPSAKCDATIYLQNFTDCLNCGMIFVIQFNNGATYVYGVSKDAGIYIIGGLNNVQGASHNSGQGNGATTAEIVIPFGGKNGGLPLCLSGWDIPTIEDSNLILNAA